MTILELLEAHTVKRPWSEASRMRCKCGEVVTAETEGQLYALHRAHLAEVLEARQQEQQARAWSDGFHKGRKTENGSHVSTWPRNPYRTNHPKEDNHGR
ncbi:hypothetical protein [Glutamicibacter sp. V16R2B1]|uniref:hypothetical protein n=1 Tax=Glutamicibacter sp. V16R2B1 TaxID=2036207 RepID=UPI0010FDA650|nr:hypothetical protein [Glutamicibacter sp. V16R2B1]TLK56299.1 hypothetical protein FDN03_02280 [Glutamicibacter sp. V16R2B1]